MICTAKTTCYIILNGEKVKVKFISTNTGKCDVCYEENKEVKKCEKCIFHLCEICTHEIIGTKCVHCRQ